MIIAVASKRTGGCLGWQQETRSVATGLSCVFVNALVLVRVLLVVIVNLLL